MNMEKESIGEIEIDLKWWNVLGGIELVLYTQHNNKDERHNSLEKYTSHFIERVVCERELETEQNCNILASRHSSVSFSFSVVAQPKARGPSSLLDAAFSTVSFLQLFWSPNCPIGGPKSPFCWVLFSLQHHFSNSLIPKLIEFPVHWVIY